MKPVPANSSTAQSRKILTALVLTGIVSVGSGLTLIKSSVAADKRPLSEVAKESLKQNATNNRLPRQVADAVLRSAAEASSLPKKALNIVSFKRTQWAKGCERPTFPPRPCDPVLVRGWEVMVGAGDIRWVFVSDDTGSLVKLSQKATQETLPKSIPIPANELPPSLDRNVVFREITSGGFTGRTFETVLLNDGRLIRTLVGDANDSGRIIRRVSLQQVRQFQQVLERQRFAQFKNLNYPSKTNCCDISTHTLTSRDGTVRYNDVSIQSVPTNLRAVIEAWNQLRGSAREIGR